MADPQPTAPALCIALTPAVQRTQLVSAWRPGEVNRARRTLVTAAGKGVNVALALARLGAPVRLVGLRGGPDGAFVAREVAAAGVDARWVESASPTRHCHTLVEEDTGRVTEVVEEAAPPTPDEWRRIEGLLQDALPGCGWLALSGALPPGAPPDALADLLRRAAAAGVHTCLDTQGRPLLDSLAARPDLVKLNAEELAATCGADRNDPAALDRAARDLLQRGAGTLLVTDGPQPARLHHGVHTATFPIPAVRVVNPIGSGDCVTAGLLFALQRGNHLDDAVRFGLACGSANAETEVPARFDPARVHDLARA